MEYRCRKCGCEIVDGVNGDVGQAPWMDAPAADLCYGCEAVAEQQYELNQIARSFEAAAGAGRFDLI